MKEEKLCDAINLLPDDMIHETEQIRANQKKCRRSWLKWASTAACLCLVIIGVAHFMGDIVSSDLTDHLEGNGQSEGPYIPWQPTFNIISDILDVSNAKINGYFAQELSEDDISAIEPGKQIGYMSYSGQAGFDGDGKLVDVQLSVTTTLPENTVSLMISTDASSRDYLLVGDPIISPCSDISYTVCQYDHPDGIVTLTADAVINGYTFAFTLDTAQQNLEQAKIDFSEILECFSYYLDGEPDLTSITPEKSAG